MIVSRSVDAAGMLAAFCTTVSFVPQLVRVWKLKSARDISLHMFLLFSFGVALWLFYGVQIHALPVILSNALTLVLSVAILALKLHYARRTIGKDRQRVPSARQ